MTKNIQKTKPVGIVIKQKVRFGVEIPDEDAEKLATVGDALRYIEEKSGK